MTICEQIFIQYKKIAKIGFLFQIAQTNRPNDQQKNKQNQICFPATKTWELFKNENNNSTILVHLMK